MRVAQAPTTKKTETFPRIPSARRDPASSLHNLQFPAPKSTDPIRADMPDPLCVRTQIHRASHKTLNSSAMQDTTPRAEPGPPCTCKTSSTTLAFNSDAHSEGKGPPPLNPGRFNPPPTNTTHGTTTNHQQTSPPSPSHRQTTSPTTPVFPHQTPPNLNPPTNQPPKQPSLTTPDTPNSRHTKQHHQNDTQHPHQNADINRNPTQEHHTQHNQKVNQHPHENPNNNTMNV